MQPDPWQRMVLRTKWKQLILNCCRQSGKTTVVAAAAIAEALQGPRLVLVVCPSERQSKRVIESAKTMYNAAVSPLREPQSATHLVFPTGANMWALPSDEANIRGFSAVSLLIVDEAARVPDDLYNAVRPMLAVSGGRLACLSTPFGKSGFFHDAWTKGEDWTRVRLPATECARISPEFLESERRALPRSWYAQEYCCEFSDTEGAVFAYDDIEAALGSKSVPLFADDPFATESEKLIV